MNEERRTIPFECRRCWHVWEEDYLVRVVPDRHGNDNLTWLRDGWPVPPPATGVVCLKCGCAQVTTFPDGYLARHPEVVRQAGPPELSDEPLRSPVPRKLPWP
ncbi:hypothetical protein [Nonomuraea sp. NPDC050310]|uniref:hypothetical protein n=1 Tax=unclassified Nonomuraea TaxID=2593643 RepID=UPI0033C40A86